MQNIPLCTYSVRVPFPGHEVHASAEELPPSIVVKKISADKMAPDSNLQVGFLFRGVRGAGDCFQTLPISFTGSHLCILLLSFLKELSYAIEIDLQRNA